MDIVRNEFAITKPAPVPVVGFNFLEKKSTYYGF